MNQQLWKILNLIRGDGEVTVEDLASTFEKYELRYSPAEHDTWARFFALRLNQGSASLLAPDWLSQVFKSLAVDIQPRSIIDPWAGLGFGVEMLREACLPRSTVAFTRSKYEYVLGKALSPTVHWKLGDPIKMLTDDEADFDLIASILPRGTKASTLLNVMDKVGQSMSLVDELGNIVMVASALRLSANGIGLFVVGAPFFFSNRSVYRDFGKLGLGLKAAFALPQGTFAPAINLPSYLVLVEKTDTKKMFVAQLSTDEQTNNQILENLRKGQEGGMIELGRFVDPVTFTSFERTRLAERLQKTERTLGTPPVKLSTLALAINFGRAGDTFNFTDLDNAIYIPLIGNGAVVDSIGELLLLNQHYAQVIIDPSRSSAQFVAHFLNSELGYEIRNLSKSGAIIPRLSKQILNDISVFVPDIAQQRDLLKTETRIAIQGNTLLGLQNELADLRRVLWTNPSSTATIQHRLNDLSGRLEGGLKEHAEQGLSDWIETVPFPLASILRAWQTTPANNPKQKYEHLLNFFEATAQFIGIILLSAYSSSEALFSPHRQTLARVMADQHLSFQRASFGTWKLVVEYLGKQTRDLLSTRGKTVAQAQNDRALCEDLFSGLPLNFLEAMSGKALVAILAATNTMRNKWRGHGGIASHEESEQRNERLVAEVEKVRELMAGAWTDVSLIRALQCRVRSGTNENDVAFLLGSHPEFMTGSIAFTTCLDVDRLHLTAAGSSKALKLLPLIHVGASPQSAKNACYFFSSLESDGARFVSYHFADHPEQRGQNDALQVIAFLTQV